MKSEKWTFFSQFRFKKIFLTHYLCMSIQKHFYVCILWKTLIRGTRNVNLQFPRTVNLWRSFSRYCYFWNQATPPPSIANISTSSHDKCIFIYRKQGIWKTFKMIPIIPYAQKLTSAGFLLSHDTYVVENHLFISSIKLEKYLSMDMSSM